MKTGSYFHTLFFLLPTLFWGCQLISKQKQDVTPTQILQPEFQVDFTDFIQNKTYNCSYPASQAVFKLYCILKQEGYSYQYVRNLLPHPIYISGPHSKNLATNNRSDFGHYNPEFLDWLETQIDEQLSNPTVVAQTQIGFDQNLRSIVEMHYSLRTYLLTNHKEKYDFAVSNYRNRVADGIEQDEKTATNTLTRDLYKYVVDFNNSGTIQEPDPYSTLVGAFFWVRRDVDGTSEQWHRILRKILNSYSQKDSND
jgi:hypothetical protein